MISGNFSFDIFTMLLYYGAHISREAKLQLKAFLKKKVDMAKINQGNNGTLNKQPYKELNSVGYWCFRNMLNVEDFKEFLGNSAEFDFFCEYTKFDFSRFEVSWLLNYYPETLDQIAKDIEVKTHIKSAIKEVLMDERIAPADSEELNDILMRYFC